MVVFYYGNSLMIAMCIPTVVNVWIIWYVILGCFMVSN